MTATVNLESVVSFPPDVLFQEVGGEAVILNLKSGIYYGLDEVGTRMWQLMAEHGSLSQVVSGLLAEYDVEEARLNDDLIQLVEKLREKGLIEVK